MDPVSATSPSTAAASLSGVVAAGHADEVAAGLSILESGGNAIDALVAAAFTGYVVEPIDVALAAKVGLPPSLPAAAR